MITLKLFLKFVVMPMNFEFLWCGWILSFSWCAKVAVHCGGVAVLLHTWSSFSSGVLETIWNVFFKWLFKHIPLVFFQTDLQFHIDSHISQLQEVLQCPDFCVSSVWYGIVLVAPWGKYFWPSQTCIHPGLWQMLQWVFSRYDDTAYSSCLMLL